MRFQALVWLSLIPWLSLIGCAADPTSEEDLSGPGLRADLFQGTGTVFSQEKDRELKSFALLIAKSLNEPEFRKFVKTEALKKFDGDFDILYRNVSKATVSGGYSFEEKLASIKSPNNAKAAIAEFELLGKNNPRLQISIPVNCEDWDETTYVPWVAFVPSGSDERTTKTLTAYDAQGDAHELDAVNPPSKPVVIISQSERVDDNGKLRAEIVSTTSAPNKVVANAWGDPVYQRADNHQESLNQYRFNSMDDMRAIEPWYQGNAELALKVFSLKYAAANSASSPIYGATYVGYQTATWIIPYTHMFYWNVSDLGDQMKYYWYEQDGGPIKKVTLTATYKGVSVSMAFDIQNDDDYIGESIVDFYTPVAALYDVGRFQWVSDQW